VADCFEVRQALGSMSAGLQPLIDRAVGCPGGSQMVRKEFGLTLDEVGKVLLERRRDAGVQFLPPDAQQGAVGGILHQGVLE